MFKKKTNKKESLFTKIKKYFQREKKIRLYRNSF